MKFTIIITVYYEPQYEYDHPRYYPPTSTNIMVLGRQIDHTRRNSICINPVIGEPKHIELIEKICHIQFN